MSNTIILGSTVNIIRAQQLQGNDNTNKSEKSGSHSNSLFHQSKTMTIGVGASAIVLGSQAVDNLKSLDQRAGISKTVNAAASATTKKVNELDQQLGVSTAVKKGYGATTDAVKGIDTKYDISGRTTRAASDASKAATNLANKALENPTVSKGWGFMRGLGKSVVSAVKQAAQQADDTVKQANQEAARRRGSAASPTTDTLESGLESGSSGGSAGETKEGVAAVVKKDPAATL
jgi:hypothetical protein